MRRLPLLLVAAAAAGSFAAPADASIYCRDLGPVPGYGPVCLVHCVAGGVAGMDPQVDPKNIKGVLGSLVIVCPA